jgi:hypothetical protein
LVRTDEGFEERDMTLVLLWTALAADFRPPAVPLVTHDPYFSIWSTTDRLTDGPTRHWTGRPHRLTSMVRIDGKTHRLMGDQPADVPALPQLGVEAAPTRTTYRFGEGSLRVTLTFTTPALPDYLDLLSRPATHVSWEIAAPGAQHAAVYFAAHGELAVNNPQQAVQWRELDVGTLRTLRIGSVEQPVLQKRGDDLRIDWGWLALAAEKEVSSGAIGDGAALAAAFAKGEPFPATDGRQPRAANDAAPTAAFALPVKLRDGVGGVRAVIAYDDEWSIQYFGAKLRPYWRRSGANLDSLLSETWQRFEEHSRRCAAFDRELTADLEAAGGSDYATLGALAHRQSLAGGKLAADGAGAPLYFLKENFSNGCIATVDVFYPQIPHLLLLSPPLAKASCVHCFAYAGTPYWRFPFAPHDLGTYPHATGQVYGQGESGERDQMPVEECGNLLLIAAAIAKVDGNADFVAPYWKQCTQWAKYLESKGFDPEEQLCTDDFAGHLAHNANLSIKAILGLAAYGQLCGLRGEAAEAARHAALAKELAGKWLAAAADGERTVLAFGKPGTWSQKYNLVWDRVLGLGVFPPELSDREVALYRGPKMNKYGPPLDSRKAYAKLDWTMWSSALTGRRDDVAALAAPLRRFLHESPSRVPMTDWYQTDSGKMTGFQARPVVGGVFMPMLNHPDIWKKWADRGRAATPAWAPIVKRPVLKELVATARTKPADWRYSLEKPSGDWEKPGFDASPWKTGRGGFGTRGTPGARIGTEWNGSDIWLRREFNLDSAPPADLKLALHHDEDVEVYLNGVLAFKAPGYSTDYEVHAIARAALQALKVGANTLAIHCRQTGGGQYIDAGLAVVEP